MHTVAVIFSTSAVKGLANKYLAHQPLYIITLKICLCSITQTTDTYALNSLNTILKIKFKFKI